MTSSSPLQSWVDRSGLALPAIAAQLRGRTGPLSVVALRAYYSGARNVPPKTLIEVGRVCSIPAPVVSLAACELIGDVQGALLWRAVLDGQADGVLRAVGMKREAGAVARLAKAEQSAVRGAFRDQGQVAFADELGGWRNAQRGIVEVVAPHWDVWSDQVVAVYSWPDRSTLRIEADVYGWAVYPSEDPGRVYRGGSLVEAVARANGGGP